MNKQLYQFIFIFILICFSIQQTDFLKKNQDNVNPPKPTFDAPKKSVDATEFINQNYDGPYENHQYFVGNIEIGQTTTYPDAEHGSKSMLYYSLISAKDKKIYLAEDQPEPEENKQIPIILWLQGGPGCSSQIGSILEFGPYTVSKKETTNTKGEKVTTYPFIYNQYNWALENYLLFIDNPIGVGFSKIVGNETGKVSNKYAAWNAAENLENALIEFFNIYQLKDHPFYIAGESFAGHYIPAIASKILSNIEKNKLTNLKGILIGDGFTDPITQSTVYGEYAQSTGIISDYRVRKYKHMQGKLVENIMAGEYSKATDIFNEFTNQQGPDDFEKITKVYPVNFRQYFDPSNGGDYFTEFVRQQNTITKLNIQQLYELCSEKIYVDFRYDLPKSYSNNMTIILDNIRVLIYQGQVDSCIPNNGYNQFVTQINHPLVKAYFNTPKQTWTMTKFNKKTNVNTTLNWGYAKIHNNLSYIVINKAGHLVPQDQPEASLYMVRKWIKGDSHWQDSQIN